MSRPEALRIARQVYNEYRETREVFNIGDVHNTIVERISHLAPSALDGLAAWACEKAEQAAKGEKKAAVGQTLLFDLDGILLFGDNTRIDKRYARREHALKSLEISDANLRAVMMANQRDHEEVDRLTPYWGPGVMKEEAVAAYLKDNSIEEDGAA